MQNTARQVQKEQNDVRLHISHKQLEQAGLDKDDLERIKRNLFSGTEFAHLAKLLERLIGKFDLLIEEKQKQTEALLAQQEEKVRFLESELTRMSVYLAELTHFTVTTADPDHEVVEIAGREVSISDLRENCARELAEIEEEKKEYLVEREERGEPADPKKMKRFEQLSAGVLGSLPVEVQKKVKVYSSRRTRLDQMDQKLGVDDYQPGFLAGSRANFITDVIGEVGQDRKI